MKNHLKEKKRSFVRLLVYLAVVSFVLLGVWRLGKGVSFKEKNDQVSSLETAQSLKTKQSLKTMLFKGETMATTYNIKIVTQKLSQEKAVATAKAIEETFDLVNHTMSRYMQGGELFNFNNFADTAPFKMSKPAIEVLISAQKISAMTQGAFDITVEPLISLWGFHSKKSPDQLPTQNDISKVKQNVGYDKLNIDEQKMVISKHNHLLSLDLSAIAKGRAVDLISIALNDLGYKNYMVEVGGEVKCLGHNERRVFWRVGIEKPADNIREIYKIVELDGQSMATSGDYRSFYTVNGKRFSHTIDPRTGMPVEHNLASVSVIHADCMTADALATGLTVLGPRHGFDLANKMGWKVFFIIRNEDGTYADLSTIAFKNMIDSQGK